jgi:beta-glucanase (GH16 family)
MKLVKHYNFVDATTLNRDEWNVSVGEKWANKEKQQYVDHSNNLFFDDGLHIQATLEDGVIKSGRINTKHKFSFKYGKIDIVAKVPKGKGTWPALWMMPEDGLYGHWPKSGEIDIMEHCGNDLNELFLCLHTEKYNHATNPNKDEQYYKTVLVPDLTDRFYTYSLLWEEDAITYYLDGKELVRYEKGQDGRDSSIKGWPFDRNFFLIINLAIGGTFGGEVDMDSFPQEFIVKDIKIYQ